MSGSASSIWRSVNGRQIADSCGVGRWRGRDAALKLAFSRGKRAGRGALLGSWRAVVGAHGQRGCCVVPGEPIGRRLLEKRVDARLPIEGEKLASGLVARRGQSLLLVSAQADDGSNNASCAAPVKGVDQQAFVVTVAPCS